MGGLTVKTLDFAVVWVCASVTDILYDQCEIMEKQFHLSSLVPHFLNGDRDCLLLLLKSCVFRL